MDNISITIPMTALALVRAAEMLNTLASDLNSDVGTAKEPGNVAPVVKEPSAAPTPTTTPVVAAVAAPATTAPAVALVAESEPQSHKMPTTETSIGDAAELDAEGIKWDARIHTGSKSRLVKSDTWKLIRGIEKKSPGLVEQVKAEQKAAPATHVVDASAPTGVAAVADNVAPAADPVAEAFAAPAADPVVTPAAIEAAPDFAGLMLKIKPRLASDGNYKDVLQVVLGEVGLEGLSDLLSSPDMLPIVDKRLDDLWVA